MIHIAQGRFQWYAPVNTLTDYSILIKLLTLKFNSGLQRSM